MRMNMKKWMMPMALLVGMCALGLSSSAMAAPLFGGVSNGGWGPQPGYQTNYGYPTGAFSRVPYQRMALQQARACRANTWRHARMMGMGGAYPPGRYYTARHW